MVTKFSLFESLVDVDFSLYKIRKEAGKYGLTLRKGKGYYYWDIDDNKNKKLGDGAIAENIWYSLFTTSVPIYHWSHQSWEQWMNDLKSILAEYNNEKRDREEMYESNFSTIRNYKPDTRNLADNNGEELRKTFKMIYELEYKLHMMSVLKYIGTQKRKRILSETYESRLSDLLTTSLIMFKNLFEGWIDIMIILFSGNNITHQEKIDEMLKLLDQLAENRKGYQKMRLKGKIILFHKCLNQTHTNGSMLKYISEKFKLDYNFEEFLNDLSNNTMLHDLWKSELDYMNFIELKGNTSAIIPKRKEKKTRPQFTKKRSAYA